MKMFSRGRAEDKRSVYIVFKRSNEGLYICELDYH